MPTKASQRFLGSIMPKKSCEAAAVNLVRHRMTRRSSPRFSTPPECEMLEDYHQRQAAADQEYQQAYTAWLNSMAPQERQQLEGLGLGEAEMPKRSNGLGLSRDASELNSASCLDEIIDESAGPQERDDDFWKVAADLRAGEAIIRIISEILGGGNTTLTAECLALATGVAYQGASESAIAKKFGITRAAVSKRCIEICERVGVKNHRAMRTDRACRAYATARVESLERQGMTLDPERPRRERRDVFGQIAAKLAVAFDKLRPEWLKGATGAELLLARRSLRPVFAIADELASMIRSKNDKAIIAQLEADLGPPIRSLLRTPLEGVASRTHLVKLCKN
jgi:hypothetical protein